MSETITDTRYRELLAAGFGPGSMANMERRRLPVFIVGVFQSTTFALSVVNGVTTDSLTSVETSGKFLVGSATTRPVSATITTDNSLPAAILSKSFAVAYDLS